MPKLVNRAKMTTATTGTGTLTLGSAVDGYQTFANAGVANGNIVRYAIEDGSAWEIGLGTYSSTGTTLTRGTIESSTGTAINLSGNATVFVTAAAGDLQELVTFAETFALPTADGTNGQVLTTNGSGTLTFSTISGYTNADVDAHLNTSTAASGEVLSWNGSDYDWVAAPAALTGQTDSASPFETSLGSGAGAVNTGANNTFIGYQAGNSNTSGISQTFVGYQAGFNAVTSLRNTALGHGALYGSAASKLTGWYNVGVGYQAGYNISTGENNILVGQDAGLNITSGQGNVAIGAFALDSATTGTQNIAIGPQVMAGGVTTGSNNIAIAYQAGFDLTTGANNFLGGYRAGYDLTTGSNNVAIGNGALDAATTGGRNIAIGQDAMGLGVATAASGDNVAIGYLAANAVTTGIGNVAISLRALDANTGGQDNVAIGRDAVGNNQNSEGLIGIGYEALKDATAGYNIGIGYTAARAITSGQNNTVIGRAAANAGINNLTTGSNNTVIGYNAATSSATVSDEITLGNASVTRFRVPGVGFQFDTTDGLIVPKTVTAGGTTGAQTINKTAGTVNFAAAATSLVVTNSFVDTNSIIIATVGTDDTTMKSVAVVAGAGSFTLYANAAATAETRVNWFVVN